MPRVRLKDEFGVERQVTIGAPFQLCAPTAKQAQGQPLEPIQHPVTHLVCYAIDQPPVQEQVEIKNQFEQTELTTVKPVSLCVPSNKYAFH